MIPIMFLNFAVRYLTLEPYETWIIESCSQKLGLRRDHANLNMFKADTTHGKAVLNLLSRMDNNVVQVNSYIVSKIICNLPVTSGASRPELSSAQKK
jgi:hypothetical protein